MWDYYRRPNLSSLSSPKIHGPDFLSTNHWPHKNLPKDLFVYFVSIQLAKYPHNALRLEGDWEDIPVFTELFANFWGHIMNIYPERIRKFECSKEGRKYHDLEWIMKEYYKYLYEEDFNKMPETERQALQDEFDNIRLEAYQVALKGEAIRLNCNVSEVKPLCPILPFDSNGDEESKLIDLPSQIFLRIMNRLETLDIFRVTLVCKKWKNEIYHNAKDLRRAEHARTTHLITFTDWMDPKKTEDLSQFQEKYHKFSLKLVGWCCRLNGHLETVIIPSIKFFSTLDLLLQLCPNLKNLQIGYGTDRNYIRVDGPWCTEIRAPDLEFFYSNQHDCNRMSLVNTEILVSLESLLYFGAQLEFSQIPDLDTRNRMHHAFENLIALDLVRYNVHILEILANIDNLKLKYFRVGEREFIDNTHRDLLEEARSIDLFDEIVGKLKTLEIFVARAQPGIRNNTIKALTQAKLNLKVGSFFEYDKMYDIRPMTEDWDPDVLIDFGEMLLSNDPRLDLTQFCFIVRDEDRLQKLQELNIGFKFWHSRWWDTHDYDIGLNDPGIKRRLGIDF